MESCFVITVLERAIYLFRYLLTYLFISTYLEDNISNKKTLVILVAKIYIFSKIIKEKLLHYCNSKMHNLYKLGKQFNFLILYL